MSILVQLVVLESLLGMLRLTRLRWSSCSIDCSFDLVQSRLSRVIKSTGTLLLAFLLVSDFLPVFLLSLTSLISRIHYQCIIFSPHARCQGVPTAKTVIKTERMHGYVSWL